MEFKVVDDVLIMYYIIIRVHKTSQGRRREGSMIPSPSKSQLRGFIVIHTAVLAI